MNMTNVKHSVLYTGITSNLIGRVWQHREKLVGIFTKKYHVDMLVFYEAGGDATGAISREKQIKAGSPQKKIDLINVMNPEWRDLNEEL